MTIERVLQCRWHLFRDDWTAWGEIPPDRHAVFIKRATDHPTKYQIRWLVPEHPVMSAPKVVVKTKGAVITKPGANRFRGEIDVVTVDLKSKYAAYSGVSEEDGDNGLGVPIVFLRANERTINLNPKVDWVEETALSFPSHAGWSVVSASVSKYTLTVVFGKYE